MWPWRFPESVEEEESLTEEEEPEPEVRLSKESEVHIILVILKKIILISIRYFLFYIDY